MVIRLKAQDPDFEADFQSLLATKRESGLDVSKTVSKIEIIDIGII